MADEFIGGSASGGEALAARIEADRERILAAYARALEEIGGAASVRRQAITDGDRALADVTRSLRAGRVQLSERRRLAAWDTGTENAARGHHAHEALQAATVFFRVTTTFVMGYLVTDALPTQLLMIVLFALNRSINTNVSEMTAAYTGFLLSKLQEAHVAERRRIARELHERIERTLSVAYRQLELYHLHEGTAAIAPSGRIETAQRSIVESLENLHAVTSDLRLQEAIGNLEKALTSYLETIGSSDVDVRLRVSGDESWAPPAVRDESFLVIREAIHNALTHGSPGTVLVDVDITPDGLHARIEDDGTGFESARRTRSRGLGLLSMRERAMLIGGKVTVSSIQSHGTLVELLVPLTGNHDDTTQ
ncbi:MAG TPA: ATP-binding protein [Streptosporangiaceae bacterium]